jgi:hypothetical protein
MAQRPVFLPKQSAPFSNVVFVDFQWNGGFAVFQKQKNIKALHEGFKRLFPERNVLEISSKSFCDEGVELSAFNLKKFVPSIDQSISLECVFQGGKTFQYGGPFVDLYEKSSRDAKKDPRLKESGALKSFWFEGKEYPIFPRTAFYDWLYVNALLENKELAEKLLQYDAFTDIEFNPEKSINCQARSAAVFASLSKLGIVEKCKDFDYFISLFK